MQHCAELLEAFGSIMGTQARMQGRSGEKAHNVTECEVTSMDALLLSTRRWPLLLSKMAAVLDSAIMKRSCPTGLPPAITLWYVPRAGNNISSYFNC